MAKRQIPKGERPEARQTLWASLLVLTACLPLMQHLQWQVNAFLLLIFAVRLLSLRWPSAMPGKGLRILLTFAGVANCLHGYHTLAGQDGGAALFATMITLKLLELESRRDLRLVTILIGFLIVVQFLFDESFAIAVYFGVIALGVVALLVHLNGGLGAGGPRPALRIAYPLVLQAIPLTIVLFVLFPRLEAPLWNLGFEREAAMTGMSDTMEPGAISELVVNGEGAFRVRFDDEPPDSDQLYWRGPVLWDMDGKRWTQGTPPRDAADGLLQAEAPIDYEVVLEPTKQRWLFALDMPVSAPEGAFVTPDLQVISHRPINSLKRYRVRSALVYRTEEPSPALRELALRLPDNITPRMRALVADWKTQTDTDWQLVQRGLAFFNREAFHYTLEPPALGRNAADEFLFETRKGFCEHYASAFALLMRIAGIPSRIVLGYLGGEDNDIGGYKIVRQSDAHAWVEVLIPERGWVRVDPTAAVDPSRIDRRSAARLLGASSTSLRFNLKESSGLVRFVRNMRLLADTLDATWQNWVLDFSTEDQMALLDKLGLGALREYGLAALMMLAVSLTLAVVVLALSRDKPRQDALDALYARFCQKLTRIGLPKQRQEGPSDYGRRIAAERPDLKGPVSRFLALYIPSRYSANASPEAIERLRTQLRGFAPKPKGRH